MSAPEPVEHPDGWLTEQQESTLCFLHWPVAPEVVRPLVPAALELDLLDGQAWVSMSPHRIQAAHLRDVPPLRVLDDEWVEVELRTYVRGDGIPGVWFCSFDASDGLGNWLRHKALHLPYNSAAVTISEANGTFAVACARKNNASAVFDARYTPRPAPAGWSPSATETWLSERYSMFVETTHGSLERGDISHVPWPLQPVDVDVGANTLPQAAGLPALGAPTLASYATGVLSRNWPLVPASIALANH